MQRVGREARVIERPGSAGAQRHWTNQAPVLRAPLQPLVRRLCGERAFRDLDFRFDFDSHPEG